MTDKQINKYEKNLIVKFLKWVPFNKEKMLPSDYEFAKSRIIDLAGIVVFGMLLARYSRIFLFRH